MSFQRVLGAIPLSRSRVGGLESLILVTLAAWLSLGTWAAASPYLRLDEVQAGSLLFTTETADLFAPATLLSSDIDMQVSGITARVSVSQRFVNEGESWTEAVYVFPLPEDAAVDSLRLKIGERVIEGEIRERQQAKAAYEAAKAAGQRTSLVEQERPNLFTTSVANIGPGESVVVEIGYLETLRYDAGTFSLRFPLAITPRYVPGQPSLPLPEDALPPPNSAGDGLETRVEAQRISPPVRTPGEAPGNQVRLHVQLDAGFPLAELESRYHAVVTERSGEVYTLSLAADSVPADRDFELSWTPQVGRAPAATLFTESFRGETYALLMMLPPTAETASPPPPREVILIIDTSGSMAGISIEQAKAALDLALRRLQPQDRFNVIAFNSVTSPLFMEPRQALKQNLTLARRFVERLQADGGTEMLPALQLALLEPHTPGYLKQVIFVTDGSVSNEGQLFTLINRNLGAARLFTVGIGSAPNSYFMRKAAEFGRGSYTFISQVSEVREQMEALFSKLESPVLTDLELRLPPGAEVFPDIVPDLYAGEPLLVNIKLPGPGGDVVLRGRDEARPWERRLNMAQARGGNGLSQLWARAKIETLNDRLLRGGEVTGLEEQITALALEHRLVTAYTSLVAVDRTPARPSGESLRSERIPQNLPHGQVYDSIFGSSAAVTIGQVSVGYPNTGTGAGLEFLVGLSLMLLAALLFALWGRLGLRT